MKKRQRKCPEASEKKIQSREKKKKTGHDQDCVLGMEDSGVGDSKRENSREW